METNEVRQENVKALAKLGVDTKDIANVYLNITEKGADIDKDTYVNNLTEMLKFFQSRNNNISDENTEAIYKEDVLKMIEKNKKLVGLDIDKKIKPICEKIDGYYFMNQGYTNKLIKNNPQIFNINKVDLEIYAIVLSDFGINIDGQTINLYEYIIKQDSTFLANDVQKVFQRIMYIRDNKNSKLITKEELQWITSNESIWNNEVVNEAELSEKYKLPQYTGQSVSEYKETIQNIME